MRKPDAPNFSPPTDKWVPTTSSLLSHAVCGSGIERKICPVFDSDDASVQERVENHRLFLEVPDV